MCACAQMCTSQSPGNAEHPNFLCVACRGWTSSSFIYLFRHPSPAIYSIVELRRSIAITQGFAGQFDEAEAFAAAESTWLEGNQNILDVLPSESASLVCVNYEDLVTNPEPLLRKVS